MKVLLSDDSKTIRMILRNLLKDLGITNVEEAMNGQEALDRLFSDTFDLILMDIHMPLVEGLDVLEAIKTRPGSNHTETPVVIISSDTDYRQIERARDLRAFGYIKKPFKKEGLEAAIGAARKLAAKRAEEAAARTTIAPTPAPTPTPQPAAVAQPPAAPRPSAARSSEPESAPAPASRGIFGWIRKMVGSR